MRTHDRAGGGVPSVVDRDSGRGTRHAADPSAANPLPHKPEPAQIAPRVQNVGAALAAARWKDKL